MGWHIEMAYYKVPQDVEAEDKLVFGLTFKQFIFAIIFFVSGFIGFRLGQVSIVLVGPLLPVFLLSGIFAFYRPKDQPAETKLLAYVNYWFKPRRRTWSRDGLLEHVIIMAPKKLAPPRIRSRAEVRSQLKTLSQIVDTRGWAVKHATVQTPTIGTPLISHEDRLIAPQEVSVVGTPFENEVTSDILEVTNPVGQNLEGMAEEAEERKREEAIQKMKHVMAEPEAISNVHAFGESVKGKPAKETSTPLTPHFQPYPAFQQKVILPGGPQTAGQQQVTRQVADLAEDDELPISAIAAQAKHLAQEEGVEFQIKHETETSADKRP